LSLLVNWFFILSRNIVYLRGFDDFKNLILRWRGRVSYFVVTNNFDSLRIWCFLMHTIASMSLLLEQSLVCKITIWNYIRRRFICT